MGPLWEPELPGGASAGAALGSRLGDLEDREPLHWEEEVIASAQQLSSAGRRDQGRSKSTAMASERTLSYKGAGRREEGGARPDAGKSLSIYQIFRRLFLQTHKMAQRVQVLAAKSDNLSSIPESHMVKGKS